jgi:hypothetical protein
MIQSVVAGRSCSGITGYSSCANAGTASTDLKQTQNRHLNILKGGRACLDQTPEGIQKKKKKEKK